MVQGKNGHPVLPGHREKAAERKEEGELPGLDDDEGDVGARQTEAYHTWDGNLRVVVIVKSWVNKQAGS